MDLATLLSVIVPVPGDALGGIARLIAAMKDNNSGSWELVVVTDRELPPLAEGDARVRFVSSASKTLARAAADGLSQSIGQFVTFLGPNDSVLPNLVSSLASALEKTPELDIVYTDEVEGLAGRSNLKPDHSPERLRSQFYWGNVTAYRRTLLDSVGGVRAGIEGAELYELALRASRAPSHVKHIRRELASSGAPSLQDLWNPDREAALPAVRRVLEEHMAATGGGRVESVSASGIHRTHRTVTGEPLVSIVIPTRGDRAVVHGKERCMVVEAVRGVVERSSYRNVEFVIVIDDVASQSVRDDLVAIAGDQVRFVDWSQPFSFSGKMNLGVLHARGEYILLLNDDVEVISSDWIESLLALAQLPGAGLVGAMLYFEDDTIQHAGHAYYKLDVTHIGLGSERGAAGPFGSFLIEREVGGVTAACALVPKSVFLEAGGFSTLLPGNFNDVDLCMKVLSLGYQTYFTPYAELYHFESKSRDPRVGPSEIRTAWGRWDHLFYDSPFWPTDPHELFESQSPS